MVCLHQVRSNIQTEVYVYQFIYTFIFLVIQVKVAKPTCQTCQFLPKQYTSFTKWYHILQKNVFKEVLVSCIQCLVKKQEFTVLAMPCQLYVWQEFARFLAGIQLTQTMFQIQVILCLSIQDLTDTYMYLICQTKQFLMVLIAALLNSMENVLCMCSLSEIKNLYFAMMKISHSHKYQTVIWFRLFNGNLYICRIC